jgi:ribonucleoside-diphosphate reductase alpha chain
VALTRMISAVFRRGGDVSFVAEELKAVFDPRGGQWFEGRYVPSLLAAIGDVILRHLEEIGFLAQGTLSAATAVPAHAPVASEAPASRPGRSCPRCGQPTLIAQEGCLTCLSCGYSKCS